jgi:hypothetical protein
MLTSGKVFCFGWDREVLSDVACGDLCRAAKYFARSGWGWLVDQLRIVPSICPRGPECPLHGLSDA